MKKNRVQDFASLYKEGVDLLKEFDDVMPDSAKQFVMNNLNLLTDELIREEEIFKKNYEVFNNVTQRENKRCKTAGQILIASGIVALGGYLVNMAGADGELIENFQYVANKILPFTGGVFCAIGSLALSLNIVTGILKKQWNEAKEQIKKIARMPYNRLAEIYGIKEDLKEENDETSEK